MYALLLWLEACCSETGVDGAAWPSQAREGSSGPVVHAVGARLNHSWWGYAADGLSIRSVGQAGGQ